ncbi:cytoplasmic tRNA 2-thiolation protein 2-like protein [Sarcoptes scabiei]|uniref:Cytoplasmic tRNA 2-thiolation protein 2 n=1 Tax=Sarcoptes scabiei TaxID=52283 RepID=A0A131ZTB7_SARSC|nr:cytoplasmic tRNA 2-thiolation protein 2-like protein [Sarcoptes scabiei]
MDQTNQQPDRCKRCDHNNFGFVRLQKKDIYCRQCLQDYCIHRFRSTVGKSHQIKYDENVLVAVSGGWSSLALADMVFKGRIIESDQHRKIKYMPSFLHLDDRSGSDSTLTKEFFRFLIRSKIPCHFATISSIFDPECSTKYFSINDGHFSDEIDIHWQNYTDFISETKKSSSFHKILFDRIGNIKDDDIISDFTAKLKHSAIVRAAIDFGFKKIMVGNTLDLQTIDLMNNVINGSGYGIYDNVNFCDNRFKAVLVLRPLYELSKKAILFYLINEKLLNLACKRKIPSRNANIRSNIRIVTEMFLNQLSETFPSTYFTIFKTGNKISHNSTDEVDGVDDESKAGNEIGKMNRCKFCLIKIDQNGPERKYNALDAYQLSSNLSIGIDASIDHYKSSPNIDYCQSCSRIRLVLDPDNENIFAKLDFNF